MALAATQTLSIGWAAPYPPVTYVHSADLRAGLARLTGTLTGRGRPTGLRVPDGVSRADLTPPPHDGSGIRYREAMRVLDAGLRDGVDVVVDAGNTGASAIHTLPVRRDGRFLVALGMGGMGYSFGAGIGMAFGRSKRSHADAPGHRTVVITGYGSFFMHGMEIHTAIQYGLPITFVLFNNNAHAMCVTREQLFYHDVYSYNRFRPSRLGDGLAAMFPGLPAVDVSTVDELTDALGVALRADGPSVLSVGCSADEVPPFAAFLANANASQDVSPIANREEHDDVAARA